jgi:Lipid-droplet associated hydrolase
MARDELHTITHDKWDNEVWGSPRTQIFILWGKKDFWIPDEYRDDLIRRRERTSEEAKERWKPVMEIDETGLPHDFCIRHGVRVAEKVVPWIREITQTDMRRDVIEN